MKFYTDYIFPWCLDAIMSRKSFQSKRREVLCSANGKILEVGLGTGLNLPAYPIHVKEITTVDVNPGMNRFAQERARAAGISIDHHVITAETLPFANESFDTIVSTWTLCSIPNLNQALQEFHRILKNGGTLYFIEHGLSRNPRIQKWQNTLTPIWKIIGCGCHLNRDMKKIISQCQFNLVSFEEFDMPAMSPLNAHTYQGIAMKK